MVFVAAGEFLMGTSDQEADSVLAICPAANFRCVPGHFEDEQPQHLVFLDAFWIDRTEVTNAQYAECVADEACVVADMGSYDPEGHPDLPVIDVTWNDANAYCHWAGVRLPTEAEWEKASRGTDGRRYPWGNEAIDCSRANYTGAENRQCVGDRIEVGSYPTGASVCGALDMTGNVWEWVSDWYAPDYYARSPSTNPPGPEGFEFRVVRGGSWNQSFLLNRSASRGKREPIERYRLIGFRCAADSAGE